MRSAGCKLITLSVRGGCGKLRARAAAADIALREPSPFADLPSPAIARMPRARFSPARCGIAATPAESADVSNRAGLAWRTAQAATLPHTGWVDVKESLPWCPSFGYPSARNSFSVATPRLAAAMAELMPCLALAMAAACPSRSGEPLGRDLARSPCDIRPSASPTVPPPPSSWEPRALTACASRAISDEAMGGDAGRAPGAIAGPHALPAAGGRLAADR
jgi:hypothetical protein